MFRRISPWIRYQSSLFCMKYVSNVQLRDQPYTREIELTFFHGRSMTLSWLNEDCEGYYTIRDHIIKWVEQN